MLPICIKAAEEISKTFDVMFEIILAWINNRCHLHCLITGLYSSSESQFSPETSKKYSLYFIHVDGTVIAMEKNTAQK